MHKTVMQMREVALKMRIFTHHIFPCLSLSSYEKGSLSICVVTSQLLRDNGTASLSMPCPALIS